jgi:hypothetical protein
MYDSHQDLLEALRATPDVFKRLLNGLTQNRAASLRGGDENWSIVEVICHLRDAEERALERVQQMRDQHEPALAGYDQNAWARERNYAAADLRKAFDSFLEYRAAHVAILTGLPPHLWERVGLHAEQGRITIAAHTLHIVSHDAIHLAQIARQMG